MEDLPAIVARNMLQLRLRRGISQERQADLAKIDRSYYGKIERGEVNLTVKMLGKVARGLHVLPSALVELPEDHPDRHALTDGRRP